MKVLFVNFNLGSTVGINNGIAILSAVLKRRGHRTDLLFVSEELGYGFDLDRMRRDILRIAPDIIGISLMEPQFKYAVKFCEDLRKYYKGFVICGGPHPTMDPEGVIAVKAVDAVCIGEGEEAICELAEALEKGNDISRIQNLWVKLPDGTVRKNGLRPFLNLQALPPEDKALFDLDRILPLKNHQLETMAGRGCVYRCTYCINESYLEQYNRMCEGTVTLRQYTRMKRVDTVIAEIKDTLVRHPEIRKIAFIDDNLLMYPAYIEAFCQKYRAEVGLPFMCNVNPMTFNLAKGELLKDAGCDDIRFGLESGSERVRREILKRPMSDRKIIDTFKMTRNLGLMSSSFNMIGVPTETAEEVLETLMLNARVLPDTIKVMTFYPFKNTPLYRMCEDLGLIDYEKKESLDDYDTFTCLKFPEAHQFFLRKIQSIFNWYINRYLDNEASPFYRDLVRRVEAMDEAEWKGFDFLAVDREISQRLRGQGVLHYAKFVNRSLAVKFPSRHFAQN